MATTITNALVAAIRQTILDNADWSSCAWKANQITWHTESEYVTASQCPVITVLYKDFRAVVETIRGRNEDGTTEPGLAITDYIFDIHLWDKAAKIDELSERLQAVGDVIRAALQDGFDLGGYSVVARIDRGSQTEAFKQGSAQLAALPLQLSVTAYGRQGNPTLQT